MPNRSKKCGLIGLFVILLWASQPAHAQKVLFRLDGVEAKGTLGVAVASIGDIDGDGVPDLAAGAPLALGENTFIDGKVFVYSGATGAVLYRLDAVETRSQFGASLAAAGDVDGDGVPDIIIGAPFTSNSKLYGVGNAFVYSGATGQPIYRINGDQGGTYLGWSVAGVGDVDGDGVPDFMIGTPYASIDARGGVGTAVVRSGATGDILYEFAGELPGDFLGWTVAALGDIDGDKIPDLLMAAPSASPDNRSHAGRAYARSGATGAVIFQWDGPEASDFLGKSLADVGDVDGDNVPDIAVGAPIASPNNIMGAGSVLVFSGATGQLIFRFDGLARFDEFGASVAGGEDVDGDNVPDIIIGAPGASPNGEVAAGSVFVFSGATGDLIFRFDGQTSGDRVGVSVAAVGDLNGDGRSEVMVGAPYLTPEGRSGAGSVFILSF